MELPCLKLCIGFSLPYKMKLSTAALSSFTTQSHATSLSLSFPPAAAAAKSLQSCLTLCDPTDGSPPSSPVPGILQARTLEEVAISFSNA